MANNEYFKTIFELDGKQAENELKQMEQKAGELAEQLKQARKENDLITFDKTKKELTNLDKEIGKYKKNISDVVKTLNNLSGASLNDLNAAQRKITSELSKMERGTKEYVAASKQLQLVDAEVKKVRNEMRAASAQQESWIGKASNGFNKYFGLIGAFAASFTGVVFGARKMIDTFNEFESKLDELSALTGLAGNDLNWLADQAKKLSTSTTDSGVKITASATEILDAYKLMGSAKPELLKDKEALNEVTTQALILAEAAKMETAPAVSSLANIMNQFGAPASEASKYINILAAGSKEGAAEVADLSDSIIRSGAAAKQANVSIEQEVALIETLAEKGIKAERAGTGLRGTLLKLQKGGDDTNPAIVGMSKALENLANKNLNAKEMTEIFGEENYTVAQILVNNRQRFEELTTAVTGTNVAFEQASINTDNNSAKLEQAKNKAQLTAIAFGEKLAPAMTFSTNGVTMFLKALMATIEFISSHIGVIASITAGIAAYTIVTKIQTNWTNILTKATEVLDKVTKAFNTTSKASPWGMLAGLVAVAITAYALFRKEQDMVSKGFAEFNANVRKQQTDMNGLFDVIKKSGEGTKERAEAIKLLNEKYGEYLPKLITEKDSLTEIEKIQKLANDALIKSIAIKSRQADIESVMTETLQKQKEATTAIMDELTKKNGPSTAAIASLELRDLITTLAELKSKGDMDSYYETFVSFRKKYKLDNLGLTKDVHDLVDAQILQGKSIQEINTFYNALIGSIDKTIDKQKEASGINPNLNSTVPIGLTGDQKSQIQLYRKYVDEKRAMDKALSGEEQKDLEKALEKVKDEYKKLADDQAAYRLEIERRNKTELKQEEIKYQEELKKAGRTGKEQNDATVELLNKEHQQRIADINKKYTDKQFADAEKALKDSYDKQLLIIDQEELKKLQTEGNTEESRKQINDEYNQKREATTLAHHLILRQMYIDAGKDTIEIDKQINQDRLKQYEEGMRQLEELEALKKKYAPEENPEDIRDADLANLEDKYKQGLLSEQEYADMKSQIWEDYVDDISAKWAEGFQRMEKTVQTFSNVVNGLQDLDLQKSENRYNKDLAALNAQKKKGLITEDQYNKKKAVLDEKKEAEEKAIKKKYASSAFALQVAEIIASTAQAAISAYANAIKIPYAGLVLAPLAAAAAVAYGGIQIAQAKAQKDAVMSLHTGGYTGPGEVMEPAGVVHKGEYVIPQWQMKNSSYTMQVVPILEAIRTNRTPYATGGAVSTIIPGSNQAQSSSDAELKNLIASQSIVISRLTAVLNNGIEAYFTRETVKDLREEISLQQTIEQNASKY